MPTYDHRIDAYISRSAEFAQPILNHLREVVHKACPNVEETIKWGFPHFDYAGSILCSMAAFKQHCTFGFWLGSIMPDPNKILLAVGEKTSMGHFGPLKQLEDLPPEKILVKYIKEAMSLTDKGIKIKKEKPAEVKDIKIPDYFSDALKKNAKAFEAYQKFSPSAKKEYLEWITEAKTIATRDKRIATALEWLEEGKPRHWKYK
jgi:uncharacterized protein YdeI (YjbR/CyaY-like superfamily)